MLGRFVAEAWGRHFRQESSAGVSASFSAGSAGSASFSAGQKEISKKENWLGHPRVEVACVAFGRRSSLLLVHDVPEVDEML
jgi:hypothetical protein